MSIQRSIAAGFLCLLLSRTMHAAEAPEVVLTTAKPSFRPDEDIELRLVIKNVTANPLRLVVDFPYWPDASAWEPDPRRRQEGALRDRFMARLANGNSGTFDQMIAAGPTHAVGVLELLIPGPGQANLSPIRVDGLCGTTFTNGILQPGVEAARKIVLQGGSLRTALGKAETVRFRWRAVPLLPNDSPGKVPKEAITVELISNEIEVRFAP